MSISFFGLDIGTSSIKAVQVGREGPVVTLTAAGQIEAPVKGILSESAVDQDAIAATISKVVSNSQLTTSNVVSALPESQIFTRIIAMPVLNDKELAAAIRWEAEEYIPVPLSEVNLDWQVLGRPVKVTADSKMEVLLIAAPKVLVEKHLRILKTAGLKPVGLETEVFAMTRSLIDKSSPLTLLISIGAYTTDICIARNGVLVSTRSIASGGSALTRAITEDLGFEQVQAEEYKKTYGLLEDQLEGKVAEVVKPVFEIIVGEIKKAVASYESKKNEKVVRAVLAGGGAKLPGIVEYLVASLDMEVEIGDAWLHFAKGGKLTKPLIDDRATYVVAAGLALKNL